ncbi:MAG: hypothetical protein AB7F59_06525 [Bdellovibrionales bacterium]
MSFNDDIASVYEFLLHTSEGNLKKMLVDNKMTDTHLRMLLKVVKTCNLEQFRMCYQKQEFPKVKFSASESNLKETFWDCCAKTLQSRGLIGATPAIIEEVVTIPKAA